MGVVLLAGLEPANPFGYAILNRARFPTFATGADSPCLLVKGADCAGDVLPVWGVVIVAGLEHRICTDVPRPRSGGGLCVPRGFGGDVLPHIPATRAMFA